MQKPRAMCHHSPDGEGLCLQPWSVGFALTMLLLLILQSVFSGEAEEQFPLGFSPTLFDPHLCYLSLLAFTKRDTQRPLLL